MKITSLHQQYLSGMIDMAISDYEENCNKLPEFCNLSYGFEYGLIGGDLRKDAVKITFNWLAGAEHVCVDRDTDSWELKGSNCSDSETIIFGDNVSKLQSWIQYVLEDVTK